jgi:phosphatidyl-myo-inositol alpha-mannosyltransferase
MFRNEDADDLARHVVALLRDPVGRAELAARGRRHADRFDWSVVAAEVMAVYETVTSGAPHVRTTAEPASVWHRLVRSGRTVAGS